jgi:hypothetical protein
MWERKDLMKAPFMEILYEWQVYKNPYNKLQFYIAHFTLSDAECQYENQENSMDFSFK